MKTKLQTYTYKLQYPKNVGLPGRLVTTEGSTSHSLHACLADSILLRACMNLQASKIIDMFSDVM